MVFAKHCNAVHALANTMTQHRKRKAPRPEPAPPEMGLLNDRQAAFELNCGLSKLAELQRLDPDFPAPVWLGNRTKRHFRERLRAYALLKAGRGRA
jgi:hypothetical protein